MISLCSDIPDINTKNAQWVRISSLFAAYCNDSNVLFWTQNGTDAVISFSDGNMTVCGFNADAEELKEFFGVINPDSFQSDYSTCLALGLENVRKVNTLWRMGEPLEIKSEKAPSSNELFDMLSKRLPLKDYPGFAVDYCRRLNRGLADVFYISGHCCALAVNDGKNALLTGIVSLVQGYGKTALKGILNSCNGKGVYVLCDDEVKDFYIKNGFKFLYYTGCWNKYDSDR